MNNMIKENLEKINYQIQEAVKKSGRNSDCVKLCAVSKFHPLQSVLDAVNAGQLLFGENRVQEAFEKFDGLVNSQNKINGIDLHIIGSLQINKVKKAVQVCSTIESVDRIQLIQEIQKRVIQIPGKSIRILFELHTGEESKSGFENAYQILKAMELFDQGEFPNVIPCGIMTMAPFTDDEKLIRKSFIEARETLETINKEFPDFNMKELSMGMSGDFEIAIQEGSTQVRVGTAIFGHRDYSKTEGINQ